MHVDPKDPKDPNPRLQVLVFGMQRSQFSVSFIFTGMKMTPIYVLEDNAVESKIQKVVSVALQRDDQQIPLIYHYRDVLDNNIQLVHSPYLRLALGRQNAIVVCCRPRL